jgi:hypothetical protein
MRILAVAALLLVGGVACACKGEINTGFEPPAYTGSPGGTPLTNGFGGGGQEGWYNPVDGGSDFKVYTYADNDLGIPVNPYGGEQFVAGVTGPSGAWGCAQHDITFAEGYTYNLGYCICATFHGDVPAGDYLGGVSLEPSATARSFSAVAKWVDVNNPTRWNAVYNVFDANGNPLNEQSAGPEWMNLELDHWYALHLKIGLYGNQIFQTRIYDLTTGEHAIKWHPNWYLAGGANPSQGLPTALRFSTGGSTASGGNTLAFDGLYVVVPEPGLISLLGLGVFAALGLRRRK